MSEEVHFYIPLSSVNLLLSYCIWLVITTKQDHELYDNRPLAYSPKSSNTAQQIKQLSETILLA